MSTMEATVAGFPSWTARRARWFLIALHLPFLAISPVASITGLEGRPRVHAAAIVVVTLAIGSLQLRHSLAAARGERPHGWPWSLGALVALVYLPMFLPTWWLTWNWASTQWFVVASCALLLTGRLATATVLGPILGTTMAAGVVVAVVDHGTPAAILIWSVYWFVGLVTGSLALYGSTRLVRVLDELDTARLDVAELAVGRERLRLSRDLHDVLGQSLSAVSLKGDLAIRLLPADTAAARREIEGLTDVARRALREMRAVARDEHDVSLRREVDAAAGLLGAAGVDAHVDVAADIAGVPRAVETVLAWAVREGTTNLLRHSDATACWITAARNGGAVRLAIVNDGVRTPVGAGSGLSGLADRARMLAGTVTGQRTDDGRFQLLVEIPEGAA